MKLKIRYKGHGLFPTGTGLLLATLSFLGAIQGAQAQEVYTWTDQDGVAHFSDIPPPEGDAETLNVEGAYRPGSSDAYPKTDNSPDNEVPAGESPQSAAQQRYEQLAKDRQERKEKLAETKELCEKNQQLLERLEPARRVYYTNDQGEEVRMDDQARVDLVEQAKEFVTKNCK